MDSAFLLQNTKTKSKVEALQFLNSRPLKLPLIGFTKEYWYWDKWKKSRQK